MSANPYAPPEAVVADPSMLRTGTQEPPFFAVSTTKLAVMSVCTLGLYELYWFYQNWRRINLREEGRLVPAARAFFAVLFCYPCFARMRDHAAAAGVPRLAAGPLAAGWAVTTLLWKAPDPYWWVCLAAFVFMLPVQGHVNAINARVAPGHDPNARYSAWNWVGIVLGGLMLVLALVGTVAGE